MQSLADDLWDVVLQGHVERELMGWLAHRLHEAYCSRYTCGILNDRADVELNKDLAISYGRQEFIQDTLQTTAQPG
jgi:hypothetical protein